MKRRHSHRQLARNALLLSFVLSSCADPSAPPPVRLEIASGDAQQGTVGAELADPVALRALTADGTPAVGVPIEWRVVGGASGHVVPEGLKTDSDGVGTARWVLGSEEGEQFMRGIVRGATVEFRAVATPNPPPSWTDVMAFRIGASVVSGDLTAYVRIVNMWSHNLNLKAPHTCFAVPSLSTEEGEAAPGFPITCLYWEIERAIPSGDSLQVDWHTSTASLAPGTYVVAVEFDDRITINGDVTTLPRLATSVIVP